MKIIPDQKLVNAFYEAAIWLKYQIDNEGWKRFSANYLREHVRCRHAMRFTNSLSPIILRMVIEQHPNLAQWIKLKAREKGVAIDVRLLTYIPNRDEMQ